MFNDDPMIAAAMLDRRLDRSVLVNIDGDSYRMRSHRARAEATRRAVASTRPASQPSAASRREPITNAELTGSGGPDLTAP